MSFLIEIIAPVLAGICVLYIQRYTVRRAVKPASKWTTVSVITEQISNDEYNRLFNDK